MKEMISALNPIKGSAGPGRDLDSVDYVSVLIQSVAGHKDKY